MLAPTSRKSKIKYCMQLVDLRFNGIIANDKLILQWSLTRTAGWKNFTTEYRKKTEKRRNCGIWVEQLAGKVRRSRVGKERK